MYKFSESQRQKERLTDSDVFEESNESHSNGHASGIVAYTVAAGLFLFC